MAETCGECGFDGSSPEALARSFEGIGVTDVGGVLLHAVHDALHHVTEVARALPG